MKEIYIAQMKEGDDVTSFFMVKSFAVKVGSNKKSYMDILLGDKTGEISGKKWDLADEEINAARDIKEGSILKIRGQVTDWKGLKQLKISKIRGTQTQDIIDLKDFIKAAPEPAEEMYKYIVNKAKGFKDEDLKALCLKILKDNKERLLYYPAAAKNHHAEMSGLLWHLKRMIMSGEQLSKIYTNLNEDLLISGVILHDIEKLNEISSNEYGISDGYTFEGQLLGHIVQGIRELDKIMADLNFPNEKAIMVEHMILSHHYEPEFGSPKRPLFPEAEMLHYLDIMDARMYDMEDALEKTEPGEFSERVWTLDNRKLYKKKED